MGWYQEVGPLGEGSALLNAISALITETSLPCEDTVEKTAIEEPEKRLLPDTESTSSLILEL